MEGDQLDSYQGASCSWYDVPCHLGGFAEWLLNAILWVPRKMFEWLADGLAAMLSELPAIPGATEMIANAGVLGSISGVVWVLDLFLIAYGFKVCFAALLIRFGLRLTPFIA